jgi:integrase
MATDGRATVYNKNITTPEKMNKVNPDNIELENDFIEYLESIDRSKGTIKQYRANLHVFWCWNLENNKNKFFIDLTKREIAKFQNHCINEWNWSPKRMRTVKATLSSLSNFIENILDDEFEGYKPIVRKIESPADEAVREKSVFEPEELQELLDKLVELGEYEKACLVALAMYSGRRKAELARFKVSYFDKENLICGGALYKTPEKMVTKGRGSRGKLLDVYVLAKQFQPYLDMWMEEREKLGIKSEWLFPKCENGKWSETEPIITVTLDSWTRSFNRIIGKQLYLHALRHFFTTQLLEQNLPESVVQSILGWSSSDMLRIYDDRSQDSQLEKYFGANGIQNTDKKLLSDL